MKICVYTDPHWCTTSSIVCQRGHTFSVRLERLIDSINWVQQQAMALGCDMVVCGGDFFDKPTLTAEEITALSTVQWAPIPQYFLVGNHEMTLGNLTMLSSKALCKIGTIISECTTYDIGDKELVFLPYIDEDNRKPLASYLYPSMKEKIVFSHNDIKGIRYGKFVSESGFSLDEIEANCSLFINGHLHNCGILNEKGTIINLGNLCGQNFTEDASKYQHFMAVLNTDTLHMDYYENPYAINFYKITISDIQSMQQLTTLKQNAVVWIDTYTSLITEVKEFVDTLPNIITRRITTSLDSSITENSQCNLVVELYQDHLDKLDEFCRESLGNSPILLKELEEICKR